MGVNWKGALRDHLFQSLVHGQGHLAPDQVFYVFQLLQDYELFSEVTDTFSIQSTTIWPRGWFFFFHIMRVRNKSKEPKLLLTASEIYMHISMLV